MVDFTTVGMTTYFTIQDLELESGHTYYVTIRGIDLANHITDASSQPVTVDTSPPQIGDLLIQGLSSYSDGLELEWEYPCDPESGVVTLEWGIGSWPGSSDVLEWRLVDVRTQGDTILNEMFYDGQIIFLSLKVINLL